MKKVSVIIPCYNICGNVENLAAMVCESRNDDYEIIFVDDCSTDGTYEALCARFEDDGGVSVIKTEKNGGPGIARNVGLKKSIGEYVTFCDSDDRFDLSKLDEQVAFAVDHDADLIVSPYETARGNKIIKNDYFSNYGHGDKVKPSDVAAAPGAPYSKLFRRELISENAIEFPNRRTGEDKCFVVRFCVYAKNIFKFDRVFYTYVINKRSITHSVKVEKDFVTTFDILRPLYNEHFPEIEERMFVETHLLTMAKHLTDAKASNKEIKEFFKTAGKEYPQWIEHIGLEEANAYRKMIYKAMYKAQPNKIKFIMWLRRHMH